MIRVFILRIQFVTKSKVALSQKYTHANIFDAYLLCIVLWPCHFEQLGNHLANRAFTESVTKAVCTKNSKITMIVFRQTHYYIVDLLVSMRAKFCSPSPSPCPQSHCFSLPISVNIHPIGCQIHLIRCCFYFTLVPLYCSF